MSGGPDTRRRVALEGLVSKFNKLKSRVFSSETRCDEVYNMQQHPSNRVVGTADRIEFIGKKNLSRCRETLENFLALFYSGCDDIQNYLRIKDIGL